MGCETSRPQDVQPIKNSQALRRKLKKADKIIGRVSSAVTISQNVVKEEQKLSSKDQAQIAQIITPHFFFSSFSVNQRSQIIQKMVSFTCKKGQYIFRQSDPGSLFFIIKKGRVSIQINGKYIKSIEDGQCFGQLSLLYTAPRSASVKTETDCIFWGLHQSIFRAYTQQLVKKNYKIARPFLQKVPLFQFLSNNQISSIAYAMNTLKYQPNNTIFKTGDDANSFYIIIEGQVKIMIKQKDPIILQKGESFGQNSFKKSEVRSGTAVAGLNGAKLLSIGRQGLLKCLGNNIQELIQFNILKWALKRSKIFENIPNELIKKIIQISEIRECSHDEIIFRKKEPLKYFIVCLEGKVDQYDVGKLINQEYILEASNSDKEILLKSNIKKQGKGNIFLLPIKKIEALLDLNLIAAARRSEGIFEDYNADRVMSLSKKQKPRVRTKVTLNELVFEKKLGEGQFGKVFLVKKKNGTERFALKCIKKKLVAELGLQNLVKNQKQIMESIDFPLIVRLEQTFKDQAFIYFLMQYIEGVDFFDMLREIGLCNTAVSVFYTASLILCIQQLHAHSIVYRDLKPENAVVDTKGFLYMIDLGTAKKLTEQKGNRTFTIIGTPHYMAPQIMQGKGYGLQVDIWSLGIMLYEMVCGKLPFGQELDDPYLIYKEIMSDKIQYPSYYYNKKGKNLIQKLLQRNSRKRQIEDFQVLKRDPYFEGFKWDQLYKKTMRPPVAPKKRQSQRQHIGGQMSILKYLDKDIKAQTVKNTETSWDQDF